MKHIHLGTIKAMARAGLIELAEDTGHKVKHWTGQMTVARYVQSGPRSFEWKGKLYGVRYFDGCFKPFVVELENENETSTGQFV